MRTFATGATRDSSDDKLDYEGFLHPAVLRAYAEYMHEKRHTPDGLRDSDNWQKGIPNEECLKSLLRHVMDLWLWNRGEVPSEHELTAACAVLFNVQAIMLNMLRSNSQPGEAPLPLD